MMNKPAIIMKSVSCRDLEQQSPGSYQCIAVLINYKNIPEIVK